LEEAQDKLGNHWARGSKPAAKPPSIAKRNMLARKQPETDKFGVVWETADASASESKT